LHCSSARSSRRLTGEAELRLYYALWPDRAVAERLLEHAAILQAAVGGRITRLESVHLTLAFLGDVAEARVTELLSPPSTIAVERFVLDIDEMGVWRHNGIGWVAPSVTPVALADLYARLSVWLESIGFALEKRAFKAHVTLLRKGTGNVGTASIETIRWPVNEYVLVQSIPGEAGTRYEILGRFPLIASG
jgi:RNA 2',3'-cyclic 3'-phosphodiesterase